MLPVKQDRNQPLRLLFAFDLARREIPENVTCRRLDRDPEMQGAIARALKDMGITNLVNLAHSYEESRIALAFYAGDGLVVKVIPDDYLGAPEVIMHLPAITQQKVELEDSDKPFWIKTYPWVPPGQVTHGEIEKMRETLSKLGLSFEEGDDKARNIHRLPNADGTLIGIDSSMFQYNKANGAIPQSLKDQWHQFIHKLYPTYNDEHKLRQTETTNFDFVSLHDRAAVNEVFHPFPDEEEALTEPAQEKTRPTLWSWFGLG